MPNCIAGILVTHALRNSKDKIDIRKDELIINEFTLEDF